MKIRHVLFLFFVSILMVFAFSDHVPKTDHYPRAILNPVRSFKAVEKEEAEEPSFTLPASLQIIGDEAFEGTALQSVKLPESVEQVGDRAFANNAELLFIQLPERLRLIGEDIIAGSENAAIAVFADSEALDQILGKNYRFFVMTAFSEKRTNSPIIMLAGSASHTEKTEQESGSCPVNTRARRTGRTGAELKGEHYKGIAALYIQSRYFP